MSVFLPVVDHELLHGQQGVVAHELVLVVHVIHHQLFPAQLLNHPEIERKKKGDNGRKPLSKLKTGAILQVMFQVTHPQVINAA